MGVFKKVSPQPTPCNHTHPSISLSGKPPVAIVSLPKMHSPCVGYLAVYLSPI